MRKRVFLTFLILFSILSQSPAAEPRTLDLDPDRTVAIVGEIDGDQTSRVMALAMMALTNNEPINILIDSPGGLVSGGAVIMNALEKIEERGITVRCVAKRAESMAMFILGACSERYAMPGSIYLWHPVKAVVQGPVSAEMADQMAKELHQLDDQYNPTLRDKLGMTEQDYHTAWEMEREWQDKELEAAAPGFMTPVDGISGAEFPAERIRLRLPF